MNSTQRRVILLGFVVILVMGLFPPWLKTSVTSLDSPPWITKTGNVQAIESIEFGKGDIALEQHAGYKFLFLPRIEYAGGGGGDDYSFSFYHPRRVDCSLLLCQWFLVSAVTGIIVMYLGDRRKSPANKPDE